MSHHHMIVDQHDAKATSSARHCPVWIPSSAKHSWLHLDANQLAGALKSQQTRVTVTSVSWSCTTSRLELVGQCVDQQVRGALRNLYIFNARILWRMCDCGCTTHPTIRAHNCIIIQYRWYFTCICWMLHMNQFPIAGQAPICHSHCESQKTIVRVEHTIKLPQYTMQLIHNQTNLMRSETRHDASLPRGVTYWPFTTSMYPTQYWDRSEATHFGQLTPHMQR